MTPDPAEIAKGPAITDCGDEGCEECDVCRYLNFLEWAGSVGKPDGSTIEHNAAMDEYLRRTYPGQFGEQS